MSTFDNILKNARHASAGNAEVGASNDSIVALSPWLAEQLKAQGSYCDASAVARKMSLPRLSWMAIPLQANVAVGAVTTVTINTNQVFVGSELRLPADPVAPNFTINSVRVGSQEMFVQGNVPGDLFSELSNNAQLDMEMARAGVPVTIVATNTGAAPTNFVGAFSGYTILGC